jgi:hypothetical protein
MTLLNFRQTYQPVAREETMTVGGSNSAIGSHSLTIRKDHVAVAFSAKTNLTAVLYSPAIVSDLLATEARAALRRIEKRAEEDPEAWATKLGNDLGSFQD